MITPAQAREALETIATLAQESAQIATRRNVLLLSAFINQHADERPAPMSPDPTELAERIAECAKAVAADALANAPAIATLRDPRRTGQRVQDATAALAKVLGAQR
jgi:hypothetical protein